MTPFVRGPDLSGPFLFSIQLFRHVAPWELDVSGGVLESRVSLRVSAKMIYAMSSFTLDPEPERALEIVVHYLECKYGRVHQGTTERAVVEIYKLYRNGVRHPLLLANKAISAIENPQFRSRAA